MVLYDYRCRQCQHSFERFAPMGEAHDCDCPACGGCATRVYSVPVTDCYSFGRNGYANRTPEHARKSYYEEDERKRHALKRELGITSRLVPKG